MEEIARSKQSAQNLFKAFQESYYDRSQPCFFDQAEVSPTKRLISMKNAVSKHKKIEKGFNNDGQYAIQYTTCPEKSYVVRPDEGKINYNEFSPKKAHKFVEKVINGKVERIEIQERLSPKKTNNLVKERSPVRITKEHVARGSLVRSFC